MSENSSIPGISTSETTVSPEVVQPYPKALHDDTWIFVDEYEPFLQSNFSSWFSEPDKGEDCAAVGRESDFKAEPVDCLYSYTQLCEKNDFRKK
ncbi:hypothetical protein AVEN_105118-1 [Araneus ventricosus]|uniref:C-type lectin domain-containing protein n=1 Tax=Araneus ventricosus TaxID=182803 RepID=A0A4Y2RDV6_ARAVE|nr:hypothetical protein AVEN_167500-1 [Araneus ventricosus]GBN73025.1 hypothetical protein AVEN_105118-1 [Araneus ventricosus]